jgi:mannosyl-oligosaccharide glucosidase
VLDESIHICHRGYISLFPFLLGLLPPDSPRLKPILDVIEDPRHLWSPYGIRSLSASHPLYGKDENYWRGPIWVQMNWLALKALKERYIVDGPEKVRAQKVYDRLRKNVVDNVFKVGRVGSTKWLSGRSADNGSGVEADGIRLGAVRRGHWRRAEKVIRRRKQKRLLQALVPRAEIPGRPTRERS